MRPGPTHLQLIQTSRWRPEFTLREDGDVCGTLRWDETPRTAIATIDDDVWRLRAGCCPSAIEAVNEADEVELLLRDHQIELPDESGEPLLWRRHQTQPTGVEVRGPEVSAGFRRRHGGPRGVDIAVEGELARRDLVLLVAGYDLLR